MNKKIIFLSLFTFLALLHFASAWQNTTFNNSLSTEVLLFASKSSVFRYLAVPQGTFVTKGIMTLIYPLGGSQLVSTIDLDRYFKLDETSGGNVLDSAKGSNATLDFTGAGYAVGVGKPGILINSYNISAKADGSAGSWIRETNASTACVDFNCSISMWVNFTQSANRVMYYLGNFTSNKDSLQIYEDAGGINARFINHTNAQLDLENLTNLNYNNGRWQHIVVVFNVTGMNLYINGTFISGAKLNSTSVGATPTNITDFVGSPNTYNNIGQFAVDEWGIWNKTLNATEISGLFNNGNALSYDNFGSGGTGGTLNVSIGGTAVQGLAVSANSNQNGSVTLTNLYTTINTYLSTCVIISGFCNVPFNFSSSIAGTFINYTGLSFNNLGVLNNSEVFNASSFETKDEGFIINITYDSSNPITHGDLVYAGVPYLATMFGTLNELKFSRGIDLPLTPLGGANNFYWNFTFADGTNATIGGGGQTTAVANLTLCGSSPQDVRYINVSYKNETTGQEQVSASVSASTWAYYLGSGTVNKSLSYSTGVESSEHNFCFAPAYLGVNIDVDYQYQNSYSQQRIWSPSIFRQTNSTLAQTLFLLPTNKGTFVTFQVVNAANQPISGVQITLTLSSGTIVSIATTGPSGTVTIFLNPDTIYTLTASKTGFTTFTATQTYSNSEYTINLGGQSVVSSDYGKGVSAVVYPPSGVLFNNTIYNFNLTLNSTFWQLDGFGFYIYNGTGAVIAKTNSSSANGGYLSVTNTTDGNDQLTMNYYWNVNGTISNSSVGWIISPDKQGSIKGFFTRLLSYLSYGILGSNNNNRQGFNLGLIIFFGIFLSIGIMVFKFGIISEVTVGGMFFALVGFFDAGLGLIGPAKGIPTTFAGLIWLTFIIREVTR